MENQTDTKETEMPQAPENIDNNNLLANMFNSFLSQAGQNESKVVEDNGNEEDEDSDDEDSDDEDSDDDKWVALQKLLDSHLRITKCLLRMIKEK
jgi:hypothetical protein